MTERMSEGLEKVYAATGADDLAEAYAVWAADYDRETLALGYCLPFVIPGFVARHVADRQTPLLDAGCGTGLSGPVLAALGYSQVDGLDMTPAMLSLSRARGSYRSLMEGRLGDPLPFEDNAYGAVFSAGVFTEGHAPASGIIELARITRPGGHLILTVRDSIFEPRGFDIVLDDLCTSGEWSHVEQSPLFRAFAIAEPDVLVRVHVLKRSPR